MALPGGRLKRRRGTCAFDGGSEWRPTRGRPHLGARLSAKQVPFRGVWRRSSMLLPVVNRFPRVSTSPSVYLLCRALHRAEPPRLNQRRFRSASGTQHRHQWPPPFHRIAAAPPAVAIANTRAGWGPEGFQLPLPQVPTYGRQARRPASDAQTSPSVKASRPPPSMPREQRQRGWGHDFRRGRRRHRRPGACLVTKTVRQERPTTLGVARLYGFEGKGGRGTRLPTPPKKSMNRAGGSLPDGDQV